MTDFDDALRIMPIVTRVQEAKLQGSKGAWELMNRAKALGIDLPYTEAIRLIQTVPRSK